jgi:predicted nucleic acid-binding protein
MTRIYVGPVPLVDLGAVGETELLGAFDGDVVVPQLVADTVSTEPAKTNLAKFVADGGGTIEAIETEYAEQAKAIVGVSEPVVESRLLEPILEAMEDGDEGPAIGLVTDDRPLRTIADGLGATVTGTFGVVVRAASEDKYLKTTQAKRIVRRIDSHGLHLTGELRAQAIGDL